MTQLTPEKIADLELVADYCDDEWLVYRYDDGEMDVRNKNDQLVCYIQCEEDARFIATFDPPTVKLLLARVRHIQAVERNAKRDIDMIEALYLAPTGKQLVRARFDLRKADDELDQLRTQLEKVRGQRDYELGEKERALAEVVDLEQQHMFRCPDYPRCDCQSFEVCVIGEQP